MVEAGPSRFDQRRAEFGKLAAEYRGINAAEKAQLDALAANGTNIQLKRFLETHLLTRAKIAGIGDGRKATLASYGIKNAFDVTAAKVHAVPGFGEAMMRKLVDWRASVERKFVFDPKRGTDPAAIQQIKDRHVRRRVAIEQGLARGPIELEQLRTHAIGTRSRPTQRLTEAHRALKQAEHDLSS